MLHQVASYNLRGGANALFSTVSYPNVSRNLDLLDEQKRKLLWYNITFQARGNSQGLIIISYHTATWL